MPFGDQLRANDHIHLTGRQIGNLLFECPCGTK